MQPPLRIEKYDHIREVAADNANQMHFICYLQVWPHKRWPPVRVAVYIIVGPYQMFKTWEGRSRYTLFAMGLREPIYLECEKI